jgi:hypothetical protein
MLDLARQRAQTLGRPVDLRLGDAQALDLPDTSYDTVVCTLSLCGIPDGPVGDDRRGTLNERRPGRRSCPGHQHFALLECVEVRHLVKYQQSAARSQHTLHLGDVAAGGPRVARRA